MKTAQTIIVFLVIIVFFSGFLYRDTIGAYFFQDDWFSLRISNVTNIRDFAGFFIPRKDVIYYRPLGMQIPFFFIQRVFGINPFPFHLLTYITHALNILLVFTLLKLIKKDLFISLLGAFMYGLSAVFYTPMFWPATYAFILGPAFFFISFIFFILSLQNKQKKYYLFSLGAFFLGLFTNEMVIVLPLILFFYQIYLRKTNLRKLLPYFLTASVLLIMRFLIFRPPVTGSYQLELGKEIFTNLRGYLLWSYNWPEEMKAQFLNFRQINPVFIKEFPFYFSVFMITILINLLLLFIIPSVCILINRKWKFIFLFFFCLIWFVTGLLPVLFFTNHTFSYYLPISLFGLLLFGASIFRYWIGIIFNTSKIIASIFVIVLIINWTISTMITIDFNSKIHWAPQRAKRSRLLVERAGEFYPKSTIKSNYIFVRPSSENKLALNNQDAFKVIYGSDNIVTIYYSMWRKIIL